MADHELFQLVAVACFLDVLLDMFGVATQEIGGDAFKAPLANRARGLDIGEVAAKERAVYSIEQKVALRWGDPTATTSSVVIRPGVGGVIRVAAGPGSRCRAWTCAPGSAARRGG